MPEWNPILGHLPMLPRLLNQLPKGAQQSYCFGLLTRDFPNSDGLFYIDLWPFSLPIIIVSTPELAHQVGQEYDLPKPDSLKPFFKPITGGLGLFMMNGEDHKSSRALFTPGFSANVILEHTGNIVDQAQVYVEILREYANKGEIFSLDAITCWYMMDVIGAVSLDAQLNSQRQHNDLASAMRNQIQRHIREEEMNPFKRYNPMRPIMEWYNGYMMDRYICAELDKRYQEWRSAKLSKPKTKSVIDLVIAEYMRERCAGDTLDVRFKSWACAQIRLFLFVGHDSTAATIVYSFYLLSRHPAALERVRKEHNEVFSADLLITPQLLKEQPQLINQLPYTTAVIKECLRLFPPAAAFRGGLANVSLRGSNGQKYPTDGMGVWVLHDAIHRHPNYWPRPSEFLPERWMVGPDHPLYPPKWAWRPFEYGTRNCIGQTLVMLDVKVTLAMTIREFDIQNAYKEWDQFNSSKGIKTVDGERAYQISAGSSHPADGFPCRVSIRQGK
ncbi:cytochrome protein [Lindgomyces ingoldianus]|uniref:Cytochrome protein n=1 Tax=Lindgomyces ingoldianus TaxID=673940 RepID=A0ACB6RFW8_9PLEO|nr:cytochrome protein [Lindgomyces ingoldianus]KAF2477215.1 cytochrome protein [Lindgomyces ingoldianus]